MVHTSEGRRRNISPTGWRRILNARWLAMLVVCAVLLAVVEVSPDVRRQITLSFVRQPVTYTELYFASDRTNSVTSPDGRPQVTVDFVVASHGPGPGEYTYQVQVLLNGRLVAERTDRLLVPDDEQRGVFLALALPAPEAWSVVEVRLLGRTERIHDAAPIGGGPRNQ